MQAALEGLLRRALDVGGFPIGWISLLDASGERLQARVGVAFGELAAERSFALGAPLAGPRFVEDASRGLSEERVEASATDDL